MIMIGSWGAGSLLLALEEQFQGLVHLLLGLLVLREQLGLLQLELSAIGAVSIGAASTGAASTAGASMTGVTSMVGLQQE